MNNQVLEMGKGEFRNFVSVMISEEELRKVVGVKSRGSKYVFDQLNSADDLRLDYDVTMQSPKKYFFPSVENLVKYNFSDSTYEESHDVTPLIIIGIHPYDLIAINQMDTVFRESYPDPNYLKKRIESVLIGSNMQNISPYSFAGSMNTAVTKEGYDIMITDLGDKYALEVGSEKGRRLIIRHGKVSEASRKSIEAVRKIEEDIKDKFQKYLDFDVEKLPQILEKNYDDKIWSEKSKKCLKCGTCTIVCPTCFCFDVHDIPELSLKNGKFERKWDSCLLNDFAKVATGENFREDIQERYRHRFMKKGKYLYDKFGFIACVGCGRCSSECLADIADPVEVFNEISTHTGSTVITSIREIRAEEESKEISEVLYTPRPATIQNIIKMTEKELLFQITLDDNSKLGHKPGQFVQLSVMGVGEAPISICSSPTKEGFFECCVRDVGNVTAALSRKKIGDKVGIRGPYGNGFDTKLLKEKDIVFIGGGIGIAPLRSLIEYVLDNRNDYDKIAILYGCRMPGELLFANSVNKWSNRKDIEHYYTVDNCPDEACWYGYTGLITSVIPRVDFYQEKPYVVVCGPPIMYKFVIKGLKEKGVEDNHIIVSLERRMKCGVGKCGHCQINGICVCQEGPVFSYADIKNLPEAL